MPISTTYILSGLFLLPIQDYEKLKLHKPGRKANDHNTIKAIYKNICTSCLNFPGENSTDIYKGHWPIKMSMIVGGWSVTGYEPTHLRIF